MELTKEIKVEFNMPNGGYLGIVTVYSDNYMSKDMSEKLVTDTITLAIYKGIHELLLAGSIAMQKK